MLLRERPVHYASDLQFGLFINIWINITISFYVKCRPIPGSNIDMSNIGIYLILIYTNLRSSFSQVKFFMFFQTSFLFSYTLINLSISFQPDFLSLYSKGLLVPSHIYLQLLPQPVYTMKFFSTYTFNT
jgi:hypothetical protein